MKKHLYFLTAALLCTGLAKADGLSLDFRPDGASTEADFAAWAVTDANDDGKTWVYSADATPSRVYYSYHSTNQADDWMISPAITLDNDGKCLIAYTFVGSSYGEAYEIWTGNGTTPADMSVMRDEALLRGGDPQSAYVLIDCRKGDTFNVGIHCTSPADTWRLQLMDFEVKSVTNPVDLCVSQILSPVTGTGLGLEPVSVEVTNQGFADVNGYTVCYRVGDDGETVSEYVAQPLAVGQTAQHTFALPADLGISRCKYNVTAWTEHPDDFMPANNACTVEVKHIGPASIPYRNGFETSEENEDLTFVNLNDDDGFWHVATNDWMIHFSRTGDRALGYNYNSQNAADDWAFLDGLTMEAGHYVLKFWYSATENHPERLRVCWGYAPDPEAMTHTLVEYNPVENGDYEESINIFEVEEAGTVYIGFYCFSDADENWLLIDDVSIDRVDPTKADLILTSLSKPDNYWRSPARAEAVAKVQSVSMVDAEAEMLIEIDGTEAARQPFTILAQQKMEVTVPLDFSALAAGVHQVTATIVYDGDSNPANNSVQSEVVVLAGDPAAMWDFEDAQLPEAFTYRNEDTRELDPNVGDEFNELGFGIFNLSHYMLGDHAMAWASWFTDSSYGADRWLVMPRMHVSGPAWFAWEAMSYNPAYPEKYEVCVSTSDDVWYYYSTQLTVNAESEYVKTRGIDLTPFASQDVYVALHLKTLNGEALVMDNLSFYGQVMDYEEYVTGVEGISNDTDGPARWYNLSGIEVDPTQAPAGVYVVRQGNTTRKALKK